MKLEEAMPFIKAISEGKKIQFNPGVGGQSDGAWQEMVEGEHLRRFVDWMPRCFRIKPTPKLRAWKPEEVPVGARYRAKNETQFCALITGFTPYGVSSSVENAGPNDNGTIPFDYMLRHYEHSIDGGKTWLLCGVMEDSQ